MNESSFEYAVGQKGRPGLHRGPFPTAKAARDWIAESEAEGFPPEYFFLIAREVGKWKVVHD